MRVVPMTPELADKIEDVIAGLRAYARNNPFIVIEGDVAAVVETIRILQEDAYAYEVSFGEDQADSAA